MRIALTFLPHHAWIPRRGIELRVTLGFARLNDRQKFSNTSITKFATLIGNCNRTLNVRYKNRHGCWRWNFAFNIGLSSKILGICVNNATINNAAIYPFWYQMLKNQLRFISWAIRYNTIDGCSKVANSEKNRCGALKRLERFCESHASYPSPREPETR